MEQENIQQMIDTLIPLTTEYGLKILGAVLILIVGRIVSGLVGRGVRKAMLRAKADPGLAGFVVSMVQIAVLAFAVIAALAKFGVQTASFVAVLGAAGFAVGFALQGSLGNFASGIMILVFKPFRVGDLIEAAGYLGHVADIGLFVTTVNTLDNQKVIIPNAKLTGEVVNNVNGNGLRRVDLVAGISYGDDIGKAKAILEQILADHPGVLADPAPVVAVKGLGDSSVDFVVRPWVLPADYWTVWFEVTESIKREFDRQGVTIPFPQRDVHMHQPPSAQVAGS